MCCAAMLPLAPARFSTTTAWPIMSVSFLAMMRAAVSVPPPGAKPTVSVTVRVGKCGCAEAAIEASTRTTAPRDLVMCSMEAIVYDVLVAGGGNAGLCAALTARELGLSVLLVESAPVALRGSNSRHTRNMRTMHEGRLDPLHGEYPEEEYWQDLLKVTGGQTNEKLARMAIRRTPEHVQWMHRHGVRFQAPLGGTLQLGRTNAFFLGGGKALMNAYYRAADALGVDIAYDTEVVRLSLDATRFRSATIVQRPGTDHVFPSGGKTWSVPGLEREVRAKTFIAAAGGFESNLQWLREAWGEAADNFIVRGTPYNMGRV